MIKTLHVEEYKNHEINISLLPDDRKLITIEKNGWKIYDKKSKQNLWGCIGLALDFIDTKERKNV